MTAQTAPVAKLTVSLGARVRDLMAHAPRIADGRALAPGTAGWSIDDFDDPTFAREWDENRWEMHDGVLIQMPPLLNTSSPLGEFIVQIAVYTRGRGIHWMLLPEVDFVVAEDKVYIPDATFITVEQGDQNLDAHAKRLRPQHRGMQITVPPLLVVESLSAGHESHDRVTKRRVYEQFGVHNYWMLDANARRLECLKLVDGRFVEDAAGEGDAVVRPSVPEGFEVRLAELWSWPVRLPTA